MHEKMLPSVNEIQKRIDITMVGTTKFIVWSFEVADNMICNLCCPIEMRSQNGDLH